MGKPHEILVLSDDVQRHNQWAHELGSWAHVNTDPETVLSGETAVPELIVTDQLPITQPLGNLAEMITSGEIAVVGMGTQKPGDVVLPADCSGRELRLACRLLVEVVHLRRALGQQRRTEQALRKMVYRDPLTGLANRRKWDQELVTRMERIRDADATTVLGIALLDLDLFKVVNDRLGHLAGDTALRRVAQELAANVSQPHLAARLGGDEFGILLSGILPTDIPQVADSVRRSIEHQVDNSLGVPPITASSGVVFVSAGDPVRTHDVLKAADEALRAAKRAGRNQTVVGGQVNCPIT